MFFCNWLKLSGLFKYILMWGKTAVKLLVKCSPASVGVFLLPLENGNIVIKSVMGITPGFRKHFSLMETFSHIYMSQDMNQFAWNNMCSHVFLASWKLLAVTRIWLHILYVIASNQLWICPTHSLLGVSKVAKPELPLSHSAFNFTLIHRLSI